METSRARSLLLMLSLLVGGGATSLWAQFSASFQTNTISGVVSNWTGDYLVGSNTYANSLIIRSNGTLTSASGYLGYLAASISNNVVVTGAGSVWSNASLYLGYAGRGNFLVVSNAGRITDGQSAVVGYSASSSDNRVLVTGPGSVWNCGSSLTVGFVASGNNVVISNGGWLVDSHGQVGALADSSNNGVLVTGTGSVWTTSSCVVGLSGSNNRVLISKGGRLESNSATIADRVEATGNAIVVADSGSVWDNSTVASVISFGMKGSGNRLVVTNGGQVLFYYIYFGRDVSSSGNSALVSGPGSTIAGNCYIYVGNLGRDNTFTAANGATVDDKFCYISYAAGSSNNFVLVTGTNTAWQNSYSVFVGFSGAGGKLTISNGAAMNIGGAFRTTHNGVLGYEATSWNNSAWISGPGSVLNCADEIYAGFYGASNTVVITNGGRAVSLAGYIGTNPGSDNNRAVVTGAGSLWTNRSDFYLGYFGAGNSLIVSNGGRISNDEGTLGRAAGSDYNTAVVTGSGSQWTNHSTLFVGCYGANNSLVISNGGWVAANWGKIGYAIDSINNQVLVTGGGSGWSNAGGIVVGDSGAGNTLAIRAGSVVSGDWGMIGNESSSSNNSVYVESGAVWRTQQICVGNNGSHNALFVNGGAVFATNFYVGFDSLFCNNLVQLEAGAVVVTNATATAVLEVYDGSLVILGGTLQVDTLRVASDCAQVFHLGGTLSYRNLELPPAADTDGDGMSNGWEQAHGLNPLDPTDDTADQDGDLMSNWEECLAGTNPTNRTSYLHIVSQTATNHDVRVTWAAIGGKRYCVQTNSGLIDAFGDCSPPLTAPGSGETMISYLDVGAATNFPSRYYRIRVVP